MKRIYNDKISYIRDWRYSDAEAIGSLIVYVAIIALGLVGLWANSKGII